MDVFDFDPASYREQFAAQGWVHVGEGDRERFLEQLRAECRDLARERTDGNEPDRCAAPAFGGPRTSTSTSHLPALNCGDELCHLVTGMCGLEGSGFVVSERHVKWYDADADPEPAAHKDRLASQISIGVSIEVPAGSTLVLYPSPMQG